MTTRFQNLMAGLLAAAALTACGGGGDDAGDNTVYAPAAAWTSLYAQARTWNMTGTYSGTPIGLSLAQSVGADGSFPATGTTTQRRPTDATVSVNGSVVATSHQTLYLDTTTKHLPVGVSTDDGCGVASSISAIAESATTGQSGTINNWTLYDSCTIATANTVGSGNTKWSVESDNGKGYLCVTTTLSWTTDNSSTVEKYCYQMSATGTVNAAAYAVVKSTDSSGSSTLEFHTN